MYLCTNPTGLSTYRGIPDLPFLPHHVFVLRRYLTIHLIISEPVSRYACILQVSRDFPTKYVTHLSSPFTSDLHMSSLFHTYTFSEDLNTAVHIASLCMHSHSHYYIYHTSFQSLHLFTHPSHTIPILVKKYLSAYIAHHIVALSPVFSIHSECILIQGRYPLYGTSRCLSIQCFVWSLTEL